MRIMRPRWRYWTDWIMRRDWWRPLLRHPRKSGLETRRTVASDGVALRERIAAIAGGDLVTPVQAQVTQALRRGIAIAMGITDQFADRTGLAALKRASLDGTLSEDRRAGFVQLLEAEAVISLFVLASAAGFQLADQAGTATVDLSEVEEVLTDNAPLALNGVLWELDQDIAMFAQDDDTLVATVMAFCDALAEKQRGRRLCRGWKRSRRRHGM